MTALSASCGFFCYQKRYRDHEAEVPSTYLVAQAVRSRSTRPSQYYFSGGISVRESGYYPGWGSVISYDVNPIAGSQRWVDQTENLHSIVSLKIHGKDSKAYMLIGAKAHFYNGMLCGP
jgi:hypothetical protein